MNHGPGSWAVILHDNRQLVGTVVDMLTRVKPKRVRVQRGAMQGEVLMPSQYSFHHWLSGSEIDD